MGANASTTTLRQNVTNGPVLEDQIGDFTLAVCRNDRTVKPRSVRIDPAAWQGLAERTNAKIFDEPHGRSISMVTPAGVFDVVEASDVEPSVAMWEFAPR
jgi:hypothetical protein